MYRSEQDKKTRAINLGNTRPEFGKKKKKIKNHPVRDAAEVLILVLLFLSNV